MSAVEPHAGPTRRHAVTAATHAAGTAFERFAVSERVAAFTHSPPDFRRAAAIAAAATAGLAVATVRGLSRPIVATASAGIMIGFGAAAARAAARLQTARAEAEQEAKASHNQLQKLIDNSSANVYMKRIDNGQYLLVNREWERLFGVTRDIVISLTDREVFPPALAEQLRANDLGVARAGKTVQYEESAEGPAGMRTYISVKFPVLDGTGRPYAICGISTDITERKQAEDEVRRLNAELETRVRERTAELEASTRELDAFAYSVSHDLRAPLRSLHGFSQALLDDYSDILDDEGRDNLNRLQRNVQRMGRMIDDLLDLSRATRVDIAREQIDLTAMANDILAELAAAEPGRTLTATVAPELHAYGDPHLVRLALQNLLANAWKFTSHRPHPTIEVGCERHHGQDVFLVRDNGAGFEMKYADKLFTAFQRLHAAAEFEGTGIGLAIVARVVRRHGGRVCAHAEPDRGATFYFTLTAEAAT
jgi:PAS domain S-box-containing protein